MVSCHLLYAWNAQRVLGICMLVAFNHVSVEKQNHDRGIIIYNDVILAYKTRWLGKKQFY